MSNAFRDEITCVGGDNMDLNTFKLKLLDTGLFQKVNGKGQYRCKTCPFCGDTKSHMYVLIRLGDDTPVMYNCFKCTQHGFMNEEFLNYFGIDNLEVPHVKNKRRIHMHQNENNVLDLFQVATDRNMIELGRNYIHERVGVIPSDDDLRCFRLIGNPDEYISQYLGGYCDTKQRVWFQMNNWCMVGRKIRDDINGSRWKKFTGTQNVDRGIYIIKRPVDTHLTVNVCVCEGVMDAIGLYYHGMINNGVYIACMGRDYMLGILHVIRMGVFGDSVNVGIYKDSDVDEVRIRNSYRKLFKRVDVYQNMIGKDYGVKRDEIEIARV